MIMNFKHLKSKKIFSIVASVLFIYIFMHYLNKSGAPEIPLPLVAVQKPQVQELVDYVTQTGTTVAFNSIDLVARVEGYLQSIEFTDGSFVKKGKELFVIQPEPYMEQLKAAQATVVAQKADYAYSKSELERQKRMYKENATSLNNVEKWDAKMQASAAEVSKDVANEAISAINYSYTHIVAPFDGRIGRHLVDVGNLVGNGVATNLATIAQVDKLYVYFNLNELDLIRLRAVSKGRGYKHEHMDEIPVYINMQNETGFKHKALLDFVNTGLNAATGTMELRAVLENKDYLFVPGLFVQVKVAVSEPKKMLTIPASAVLYDQIGSYIYVVDKDNLVLTKRVVLGTVQGDRQAVTQGVEANDRVIVAGLQNVTPGHKVQIQGADESKTL